MRLKRVRCLNTQPAGVECYKGASEKGALFVMKEFDQRLRRWHVSISGWRRKPTNQESLEVIEALFPGAGRTWKQDDHIVNPYVRHFFAQ